MAAFSSAAFSTSAFSVNAFDFYIPPPAILQGGHFGFDEKKRRKRWDSDLSEERRRKEQLQTAFYGLPEAEQEVAAEAIFGEAAEPEWAPVAMDTRRFMRALDIIEKLIDSEMQERDDTEIMLMGWMQ